MVSVKTFRLNFLFAVFALLLAGCSTVQKMEETVFLPQQDDVSPFIEREDANGIFLNEAWQARTEGRYDEADVFLSRAMRINPTDPEIYYHMALLRQQQGKDEQARQLAGRAVSLGPEQNLERQLQLLLQSLSEI